MPDSASTPDQPSATARATKSSQTTPAATRTITPPHRSADSTLTPSVARRTTLPAKPASAIDQVGPATEDEQRLVGVVDLADGVDDLVDRLAP